MNIYDSDGALDLDAARKAGNALPGANTDPKVQAQRLTIAALLDIAESLRPLAAEATAAMNDAMPPETRWGITDFDEDEPPFEKGDVVYVEGIDAPGEIVGLRNTEGETFAIVAFGEDKVTAPLRHLHRLVGDEGEEPDPRAEVIIEGKPLTPAEVTLMDGTEPLKDEDGYPILPAADENEADELDEDFDDDFDTSTAAEDAVAALAKAEAKRKADKKGKGKK